MDFGCGNGSFLLAGMDAGFNVSGVELNAELASSITQETGCKVFSVQEFFGAEVLEQYDVIHIGDVLEHVPQPYITVKRLLDRLRPGGIIHFEGPLENNLSIVWIFTLFFYMLKKLLFRKGVPRIRPTHLYRADEIQQLNFFNSLFPQLELLHWRVYETGWPYAQGGFLKKRIAHLAIALGSRRLGTLTYGNRFEAIFKCGDVKFQTKRLSD